VETGDAKQRGPSALLIGLFGAIALGVAWASLRGPLPGHATGGIAALLVAGAAWCGALAVARRLTGASSGLWIVAGAIVLRLIALGGDPQTSDDHYRYAWEGGLVLDGKSPYANPPDDPTLALERERRPTVWAGMNNRDVSAAYPPAAQVAFAACVWAASLAARGPAPPAEVAAARADVAGAGVDRGVEHAEPWLRAFFAAADLLVLLPLWLLASRRAIPAGALVAWAWSPLVALEFAGAAHFDSLGILLLVAALAVAERARGRVGGAVAGALLGAGAMVKLLPLALLPFLARAARGRGAAAVVAGFAAVCALAIGAIGLLEGGLGGLSSGLSQYALRWEAASLVHRFVEGGLAHVFEPDGSLTDPRRLARALAGVAWLAVMLRAWRRGATPDRAAFALLGAFLVLSPTLHPWYVTWIVPLLCLRPSRAFAYLAAIAPVLYAPLAGWVARGEWVEPAWLWPVVAAPFFALLLWELRPGTKVRRA